MQPSSDEKKDAQFDANVSYLSATSSDHGDNATERHEICWDIIDTHASASSTATILDNNLMDSLPPCESDIEIFLSRRKKFQQQAHRQW